MGFRIGLLGSAEGDLELLREAVDFLLGPLGVDRAVYLGDDPGLVHTLVAKAQRELLGSPPEHAFLRKASEVACDESPQAIRALLSRQERAAALRSIHLLPPRPAKAVELVGDRLVLMAHDLADVSEEDQKNTTLLVYGNAEVAELRRTGTLYFLTPGPLAHGRVALIEREGPKRVAIALHAVGGSPIWRETLRNPSHKLVAR